MKGESIMENVILQNNGNVPTSMICDNEGCDGKGGGDEGVASVEYHDNKWASVYGYVTHMYGRFYSWPPDIVCIY